MLQFFIYLVYIYVPNKFDQGYSMFSMARICPFLSRRGLYFTRILLLMLVPSICLMTTSVFAQSGTVKAENSAGYSAEQSPPGSPDELSPMVQSSPLVASAMVPVLDAEPADEKDPEELTDKKPEPITRHLPILGEKAREKGYDLPLPFGVGANFVLMSQNINLRNVKVGIGEPNIEIEDLDFKDAQTHDAAITSRLDLWLLPFANVYGIFGYINGEAELDLDISAIIGNIQIPGLPPIILPGGKTDLNIDYNGTTYGGGMTLAAGYKNFFASIDGNYTYSNIDVVDGKIRVYTFFTPGGNAV